MTFIKNSHDKFFKETMSDIETSKDFLKNYLPKEILNIVDIEQLSIQKDTFIDTELQELFSDMLFKTVIHNKDAYIYFLFEHKSYQSHNTGIQLLKYIIDSSVKTL